MSSILIVEDEVLTSEYLEFGFSERAMRRSLPPVRKKQSQFLNIVMTSTSSSLTLIYQAA
jgi:hypothetical protein